MDILVKNVLDCYINMSRFSEFIAHYNKPGSFARQIIEKEINEGLWDHPLLDELTTGCTIIDAGANVGLFAVFMLPKAKEIICIEPDKEHMKVLFSLKMQLKTKATINCYPCALYNKDTIAIFKINPRNTTENRITKHGEDFSFSKRVEAVTLQRFIKMVESERPLQSIDLLKLDIEGAEQQVILEDSTSGEVLKRCGLVYIEAHPEPYGDTDEKGIIQKMESLGFTHHIGAKAFSHWFKNANK